MRRPWSCYKLLSKSMAVSWWRVELWSACNSKRGYNLQGVPPTAAFCLGAALDELKLSLGGRASTRLCKSADFGLVPTGRGEPAPFPGHTCIYLPLLAGFQWTQSFSCASLGNKSLTSQLLLPVEGVQRGVFWWAQVGDKGLRVQETPGGGQNLPQTRQSLPALLSALIQYVTCTSSTYFLLPSFQQQIKAANIKGLPGSSVRKESACNAGDPASIPGLGRFPWRRKWQPTSVFVLGKSHGQRNLAGYSLWGRRSQTQLSN